jgi:membrane protease YdiL (CAAX protease family)
MSKRRIAILVLLTLLPWPAVWLGMYQLSSIGWTFFLYHGVCLLPGIVRRRCLWLPDVKLPTAKQWLIVSVAAVVMWLIAIGAYLVVGPVLVSATSVLQAMTQRGYNPAYILPFAIYFVCVNSTLEELFWRGVVFNELEHLDKPWVGAGYAWATVTFAGWHYLVMRVMLKPGLAELSVLGVFCIGVACSFAYRQTKSIVMAILVHAIADLGIIAVFIQLQHAS